ncbi:MAG: single-stranded-DNA-specific exonuclease RecJ [Candidatus Marinimicrobia bacterium]|jgi:single-stranded-DNA-specific exonuclease|nr:single-stranded-DNA-specific exonuclease RecJ [Candidatus Neomarinimicrobiota bacterium]MDP6034249.1 single-stranded-DNA-specific exonuclease RecJ [Candidatus Neomarinimicrobiota bacterium]MDP6201347.1 single-stranded-DNA-specific exonuclease RecJ [Candidatus Neomarinimicrobiota bacterium]MDP7566662.1 single-stranded-DNA-specific exonuclease RecJ [Candidatus Neomarinimicrobiota bacterium]
MRWKIKQPSQDQVTSLKKEFNTSEIIAKVLANRGIESLKSSHNFFNPSNDQLHDPFIMKNMDIAVDRISKNIQNQKPILIFGDYDVDGTTGASLLYLGLKDHNAIVEYYIPHREKEGYGLSTGGIDYAQSIGADLLITCDCGINAFKPVDDAADQGIDVIITDHHIPDKKLPNAYAVLNPKQKGCEYPFKGLCGCGVAFKLISALSEQSEIEQNLGLNYLDLVALATSADMVPILDENRVLVHCGLDQLEESNSPGIHQLLVQTGLVGESLNVGKLVFGLAPKINAAGRMGDANRTVELLTTSDKNRAEELASILVRENKRRQLIQEDIVNDAIRQVYAQVDLENSKVVIVGSKGWHPGVIGIVASRIKDEFSRPAIVIAFDEDGIGKGSARSIPKLDLYDALAYASKFLEGFGGHPMAAGLTVLEDRFENFKSLFLRNVNKILSDDDLIPVISIDGEMELKDINPRFMRFLEKLGPFGPGNMRPKFMSRNLQVSGQPRLMGKGEHIRFIVSQNGRNYPAVGFKLSSHYEDLIRGVPIDLAYVVEVNEWQGQSNIQLNVRDIHLSK